MSATSVIAPCTLRASVGQFPNDVRRAVEKLDGYCIAIARAVRPLRGMIRLEATFTGGNTGSRRITNRRTIHRKLFLCAASAAGEGSASADVGGAIGLPSRAAYEVPLSAGLTCSL